jgi:eukaryotic-like serine/threonine-protein kinase
MRLAALTASSEDVDELSKTFKIARPSAEAIRQAAPVTKAPHPASPATPRPAVRQGPAELPAKPGGNNLILIAVVVLVLLGIAVILVA